MHKMIPMANEQEILKELKELRTEVKQLREIVNMLMEIVMEGEEDEFDDIDLPERRRDRDRFLMGM